MIHNIMICIKGHSYECHAICVATITLIIMIVLKVPVKKIIADYADKKTSNNVRWRKNKDSYVKQMNGILIILDIVIAFVLFTVLSLLSPFIHFSFASAVFSGMLAVSEYAFFEQLALF